MLIVAISICALATVAFFLSVFVLRRHDPDFTFLSAVFIVVFFFLPLTYAWVEGGMTYFRTNYPFSESDFSRQLLAISSFLLGYSVIHLLLPSSVRRTSACCMPSLKIWGVVVSIFSFSIVIFVSDLASSLVSVRRGEASSNPILVMGLQFIYVTGVFAAAQASLQRKHFAFFLTIISVIILAVTLGGRMLFASTFCLILVHARFPLRTSTLITVLLFSWLLPYIVNGKAIVYALASGGGLSAAIDMASLEVDVPMAVFSNFGHIVISFHQVDTLKEILGYRYFYDFFHGFLFYLRLFGVPISDSLTYYNTEILLGVRESVVPTGFLAFGYVQLSYLGISFCGAFYRALGFLSGVVAAKYAQGSAVASFYLAFIAANTFYMGEVRTIVLVFLFPLMSYWAVAKFLVYSGRGGLRVE